MSGPINHWIGAFGEEYFKSLLEQRGYYVVALQNASDQGIDLIAMKSKYGRHYLLVIEVKSSSTNNAPSRRGAQRNFPGWAVDRLSSAANGTGRFAKLTPQQKAAARLILQRVAAGTPVGVMEVAVTQVGRIGAPIAGIRTVTRVPKVIGTAIHVPKAAARLKALNRARVPRRGFHTRLRR